MERRRSWLARPFGSWQKINFLGCNYWKYEPVFTREFCFIECDKDLPSRLSTRFKHGQTRRSTRKIVRYAENRLKASGGHGLRFPTTCHESRNMYISLHEKMPDNAINITFHASDLTNRKIVRKKGTREKDVKYGRKACQFESRGRRWNLL